MLSKKEYIKLFIFFILFVVIILVQILTFDHLERLSIPIITTLQKDSYLNSCMQYITILGSKRIKYFLVALIFSICNYYHAFLYVMITFTSMFACNFLKINLQQARPFWTSKDIMAYECETGYGYPSNHVLTTVPAVLIFFEIMYHRFELDKTVNAKLFYWCGMIVNGLICLSVGFSRLVLGVHSLDQVLFGLIMGFAFYYFFLDIIDFDMKDDEPFLQYISNPYHVHKFMFTMMLPYFLFLINLILTDIYYLPEWSQAINEKCGKLPYLTPFFKCLVDSADYFVFFGAYYGLIYDIRVNYNNFKYEQIPMKYIYENISDKRENRIGKWNDTNFYSALGRIILCYIQIKLYLLIGEMLVPVFGISLITLYFFSKAIPGLLIGFITFGLFKKECYYLGLANTSDDTAK